MTFSSAPGTRLKGNTEKESCKLTRLHELVNLIGHHVENLPHRIATDEKPD